MARRVLNRRDLRDQFDAAERRKDEDETEEGDEEEEEEEEESAEGGDEETAGEEEAEESEEEGDEEEAAKPKKKPKKKAEPKAPKPKRTRVAKVTRMKVVWGVFNNSNQRVATYAYPQKKEADEHAARLKAESKTGQTHFVQPVKEPIEEPK
jgi:hypothetical protein